MGFTAGSREEKACVKRQPYRIIIIIIIITMKTAKTAHVPFH
jgi:hypothetical protein